MRPLSGRRPSTPWPTAAALGAAFLAFVSSGTDATIGRARQDGAASVPMFAGNAQHTAIFEPPVPPLQAIRWTTSIDLAATFRTSHYGSPIVTADNTVIVPVKTATDGFLVQAHDSSTGALKYAPLVSDYVLPAHNWVLPYGPALASHIDADTGEPVTRLYFAGAGGTLLFIDRPDQPPDGPPQRHAFYGLDAFDSNPGAFTSTVFVNTPLTTDRDGNVYFGFRVQGTAPAPLSTSQSGIARLAPDGTARWVLAADAAGDPLVTRTTHNAAPALSQDESTVYVALKSATTNMYGYLVALDAATLARRSRVFLRDPRNNRANPASLSDDSTASPAVAPDGDVYFGVQAVPNNGARGFLLRFSADLSVEKTPGGFGWDLTAGFLPASMVPSYVGTSNYLVFVKYNNYAFGDGDGVNRMAILDPNASQIDPHPSANQLPVMREVLTVIGAKPDEEERTPSRPHAVREWCINTAAINPATRSIFAPNEDGFLYRWDLETNSLSEAVRLTPGFLEPYVPTIIGPDGTVYTLNGGTLFAIGAAATPLLTLESSQPDLQLGVDGESVTFTARLSGAGTIVFSEVFYPDFAVHGVIAELARVPLQNGAATFTTAALGSGTHMITARHESSDATATRVQRVHRFATVTRLTVAGAAGSTSPTLTARVTADEGTPTGMVHFHAPGRSLAQVPVDANGTATATLAVGPGVHDITASYASDSLYAGSSTRITYPDASPPAPPANVSAVLDPRALEVTVTWDANPSDDGVVEYEIWRTARYSREFILVGITAGTSWIDPVPISRQTWRYFIVARDGSGNPSARSHEARARPR